MEEVEVCAEEVVYPEKVCFHFVFLCCCLYHNGLDLSKQKGWIHKYFVCDEKQLVRILEFILKTSVILAVIKKKRKKKSCIIFVSVTQLFKHFSFDLSRIFEGKITKSKFLVLFKLVFNTFIGSYDIENHH